MKLISAILIKKMFTTGLCMLMLTGVNARVFWNKFDVTISNGHTVILTWNVTEYNNKSFIVQHSINGTDWEDITVIQSKNSPESMTDYSYTHFNKLSGKQFYRLKDFDIDTKSIGTSPVKTVMLINDNQTVIVWPNPATSRIQIANDNGNTYTKVKVIDLTGKMMIEKKLGANINEIALNELSAGIYMVKIENNKGKSHTQKIVKQ
jgi:Secretion system C-terminal sorting domain